MNRTRNERKLQKAAIAWRVSIIVWAVIIALLLARWADSQQVEAKPIEAEPVPAEPTFVIAEIREIEPVEPVVKYYEVDLDEETQDLLRAACEESGIEMELALAVIWKETRFRNVTGDEGASAGYMQIQERWHKDRMERLGVTDLNDAESNFRVGCDFLAELLDKYPLAYALTYYNSGKVSVSAYAESVMDYMEELK